MLSIPSLIEDSRTKDMARRNIEATDTEASESTSEDVLSRLINDMITCEHREEQEIHQGYCLRPFIYRFRLSNPGNG
jgi:hypothetical protein